MVKSDNGGLESHDIMAVDSIYEDFSSIRSGIEVPKGIGLGIGR